MEPILQRCAGLDVHKAVIVVCVLIRHQGKIQRIIREFGTSTSQILAMADWLAELKVSHLAMESTGVYWKPIWNLLEGQFQILLCNAQHIKQVPGRKTDVKDCQWIAELLMHGLLHGSFVPPRPLRELRDLTRQRSQLVAEKTRVANRIQKVLEDANIKLSSVASDVLGVSGRQMILAIINGEQDEQKLADLARQRLRKKIPQLREALAGRVNPHHRFLLKELYEHLLYLEQKVERFSQMIQQQLAPPPQDPGPQPPSASASEPAATAPAPMPAETPAQPLSMQQAVELLMSIPGVDRRVAECLVAEIGIDMSQFPSDGHLASWAGMCSGNNQSAGKRKSGKTRKGDRWLRDALCQAGWAAGRTRDTYLSAQFQRICRRRGKKRAVIAVGHSILTIAYHVLKNRVPYVDLGPEYFQKLDPERLTRDLVRRLERLGHKVTLQPASEAA